MYKTEILCFFLPAVPILPGSASIMIVVATKLPRKPKNVWLYSEYLNQQLSETIDIRRNIIKKNYFFEWGISGANEGIKCVIFFFLSHLSFFSQVFLLHKICKMNIQLTQTLKTRKLDD